MRLLLANLRGDRIASPRPGHHGDDPGDHQQSANPCQHRQADGGPAVRVPLTGELLPLPLTARLGRAAWRARARGRLRRRRRHRLVHVLLYRDVEGLAEVVLDGGGGGDLEVGAALLHFWPPRQARARGCGVPVRRGHCHEGSRDDLERKRMCVTGVDVTLRRSQNA